MRWKAVLDDLPRFSADYQRFLSVEIHRYGMSDGGPSWETYDDDLSKFEADGAAALPVANDEGYVGQDGARIWYEFWHDSCSRTCHA